MVVLILSGSPSRMDIQASLVLFPVTLWSVVAAAVS